MTFWYWETVLANSRRAEQTSVYCWILLENFSVLMAILFKSAKVRQQNCTNSFSTSPLTDKLNNLDVDDFPTGLVKTFRGQILMATGTA